MYCGVSWSLPYTVLDGVYLTDPVMLGLLVTD